MNPAQYWALEMQNRQMQQEQQRYNQALMMQGISEMAGTYAENKAMDAKGKAYGEFLDRHGEQLGFDGEYLESLRKKKPRELATIGDSMLGMQQAGQRINSLNYMQQQANTFGGRSDGPAAGGAGGGQGAFYTVQ